ncbi:DNA cytosine methyltransferase [Variovorax sp. V59]|uniref:DNA cytosine methyltransferase n=1 Tax=unclassified Variovorax TaxID=663243 RepID=UPI0034E8BAC2
MLTPQFVLPIASELVIDLFAGGGGASTGIEQALGRHVDIAVNHDREAVALHQANHPQTRHYVEDVYAVDPIEVTEGRPVGLLWASPDCTYHSKARGGKPHRDRNKARRRRGLAWAIHKWVRATKPRVVIMENVEEWRWWGPLLDDGQPCPARRGQSFERWAAAMRNVGPGYTMEFQERRACDDGTPTIRNRLYVILKRIDDGAIAWPAATHGPGLKPYRTAAECIDFNLPSVSIFDRPKPLAHNTLRRVAKGTWRHALANPNPFIVNTRNGERAGQAPRTRGKNEPYWTITAEGSQGAVAQPVLAPFIGDQSRPMKLATAGADESLRTACASVKGGHFNLTAATLLPLRGTSASHLGNAHDLNGSLSTVSAGGTHHALAQAHLMHLTHHGERPGVSLGESVPTITAANRGELAIATAHFEQANGGFYEGAGRSAGSPMSTITTAGSNQQLVTAYLVKYYGEGGQWQSLKEGMHTVPTKDRMGLVQLAQVPLSCLAPEHRSRAKQCADLLHEHLPEQFPDAADLVVAWMRGGWYVLVDITLRMLQPRELYNAQGFPPNYIIDHGIDPFTGQRVTLTKTAQVRMCGNSVCPPVARAIVAANYCERERERERALA